MSTLNEIINNPNNHLIDVREPYEVAEVSVKGATNIPMGEIMSRLEEFKKMEGEIVVFCRSGARSGNVMQFLNQHGFTNITNGGGYADVQAHLM